MKGKAIQLLIYDNSKNGDATHRNTHMHDLGRFETLGFMVLPGREQLCCRLYRYGGINGQLVRIVTTFFCSLFVLVRTEKNVVTDLTK